MDTYEIEIQNMDDDTEMHSLCIELFEGSILGEDVDEIGLYLQEGKPRSVFVDCTQVHIAVRIIRNLGYIPDCDS